MSETKNQQGPGGRGVMVETGEGGQCDPGMMEDRHEMGTKIKWEETWGPMSPDEIKLLGEDLRMTIPSEYELFLRDVPYALDVSEHSGGVLETTAEFLCGRGDEVSSVRWAHGRAYDGALERMVPFAVDAGGNYFALEPLTGAVHLYFHDRLGSPWIPVAPGFFSFLAMLYEEEDD